MSFLLCCCPKNKADGKGQESYKNYPEEIRELEEKLNQKQVELESMQEKCAELSKNLTALQQEFRINDKNFQRKEKEWGEKLQEKDKKIKQMEGTFIDVMPPVEKRPQRRHRPGVGGNTVKNDNVKAVKVEKNLNDRKFLLDAIASNDLLKRSDERQKQEMVDYMQYEAFPQNKVIIKEGMYGDRFYIIQIGTCDVTQNGKHINTMNPGTVFGELAILYGCKRTATIKATKPVKAWYLERQVYQSIRRKDWESQYGALQELVKNTPLKDLGPKKFLKISDAVTTEEYERGDFILRQGEIGETFYIIKEGEVDITIAQESSSDAHGTWIRTLVKGSYFGEKALLKGGDTRTANVIAKSNKVICLTLDQENFIKLIGDDAKVYWPEPGRSSITLAAKSPRPSPLPIAKLAPVTERPSTTSRQLLQDVSLKQFESIAVLGQGGFGKVELVCLDNRDTSYALKCMKKSHIVETKQEEHVYSEKNIMMQCHSSFIVRLYRTFKNERYVYMLMEACLGGELWTRLRDETKFPDSRAKFYTACVVEALDYLHQKGIVYRDLKPENLLLDKNGYVKVVDFGFAKMIQPGERTWTFCGTPEYVAPEIILNQGHDVSADYWALGILVFEFLAGNPPFNSADAMRTYRMALRGIDAVEFPLHIKKPAQNMIKRLCREKPTERLGNFRKGIDDIRNHKWFTGFDWKGLQRGSLQAEYIPIISSAVDTQNFDKFERVNEKVPSENSGWDENF
uniref:cGMP-dependent protein kinase 1-like n=1 Tax=Styela clava TaxID=7725 RepID=UPI00193A4D14|nr:cGMP-dependent protein kinase 1-like [Styela clava]